VGKLLDLDDLELDLASLPFEDARFDGVLSAFGPMFSSDGRKAIDELFRVVRPGGTVAFTAWAPLGVVGRLLRLAATHDPLPRGVPPPLAWGREERLRQDLDCHSDDVRLHSRELMLCFDSGEQAVERLFEALGPLAVAPRQDELRAQALAVVAELEEEGAGPMRLRARYLLAEAVRRPVLY
jgi:SAM-dependent methyltransferase